MIKPPSFRPLDNSVSTQMKYDIEAAHWTRAVKNAQANVGSGLSAFGLIGLLLSIVTNIFFIIITLIVMFVEWLIKPKKKIEKKQQKYEPLIIETTDEQMKNVLD